jgi:HEAT repeat protein
MDARGPIPVITSRAAAQQNAVEPPPRETRWRNRARRWLALLLVTTTVAIAPLAWSRFARSLRTQTRVASKIAAFKRGSLIERRSQVRMIVTLPRSSSATSVPRLLAALDDPDSVVRHIAARGLGLFGQAGATNADAARIISALRKRLRDPDAAVRLAAAISLERIGAGEGGVFQLLVDALQSNEPDLADDAAEALRSRQILAPTELKTLLKIIADGSPFAALAAAKALTGQPVAFDADLAVNEIVPLASSSKPIARRGAIMALAPYGPDSAEALETILHALLFDLDPEVRFAAVAALDRYSSRARAREGLRQAESTDSRVEIRIAAAAIVAKTRRNPYTESWEDWWADIQLDLDKRVIALILTGSTDIEDATERLIRALDRSEVEIRLQAAEALGDLGPHSQQGATAMNRLIQRVEDSDVDVRVAAIDAIAQFNPQIAAPALASLEKLEKSDDRRVAAHAAASRRRILPPPAQNDVSRSR